MQNFIATGNLTKDVEMIGENLAKFVIAVPEDYEKDGERPVQFFTVICWNKLAENCAKYLKKGSKVLVEGKIQNRTYEAQDGTKKYVTEVVAKLVEFILTKKDEPKLTPVDDANMPF